MVSYSGFDDVIKRACDNGQGHLFDEWDSLAEEEKKSLLRELSSVDFDLVKKLFREKDAAVHLEYGPAPFISLPATDAQREEFRLAREAGIKAIRGGKVAAFLVAGGQGSRLGFEGPKGKFPVGPVSGKTLFCIHAEKILKYSRKYGVAIPFLIMTSEENHVETTAYFKDNKNFGIPDRDMMIFPQNMIPSLDAAGNLVLKGKNGLFRNPDGHGGSLTALNSSGALKMLADRGIDIISYFQVDNPLVRIVDPEFIGFHVQKGAHVSSKALKKAYPEEKIGVFVKFENGRIGVMEYSDLPEDRSRQKDSSGGLAYSAGSIAIHLFDRSFVERVTAGRELSLPFHTARKKLKVYEKGAMREIEGLKFEKFVFDALPLTEHNVVFETLRSEEFAPVKNPEGVDSVHSARDLMVDLHRKWLLERGVSLGKSTAIVEISPLLAVEPDDIDPSIKVPDRDKVFLE